MSRAENKTQRLLQMEALLLSHPEGLTQSEIARHLGVDRSVIHRNLYDFGKLYPVIEHEDGRVSLDRSSYLVKVAFTLHEAMGVHLASRLLATRMDKHNPHAASALRKLGIALEKLAPRISTHVKQSADAMNQLFFGVAHVSIQGERVLRFLNCSGDQANYEVIGFDQTPVRIIDFRINGLRAIQELLETEDLQSFAPKFNYPAEVRITIDENQQTVIELRDTDEIPGFVLWIAIGLGNSMPVYRYYYENIVSLPAEGRYALVTVYQISSASPRASSSDLAFVMSSLSSTR